MGSSLCDRPTQTQTTERERERGIPIRQATPEKGSVSPSPPGHHHRQHPAAPAHLPSHTQQPRHLPYQNNYPQAALSSEVLTCVGIPLARMRMEAMVVVGRCCQARLVVSRAWIDADALCDVV